MVLWIPASGLVRFTFSRPAMVMRLGCWWPVLISGIRTNWEGLQLLRISLRIHQHD